MKTKYKKGQIFYGISNEDDLNIYEYLQPHPNYDYYHILLINGIDPIRFSDDDLEKLKTHESDSKR